MMRMLAADVGSVLQFTPDNRYTVGAFTSAVPAAERSDGRGDTWVMPFLGWAVVVETCDEVGRWGSAVHPVFLSENGGRAVTGPDVEDILNAELARLVPAEPGGLR